MEDTAIGLTTGSGVTLGILIAFFRMWAGDWPVPRNGSAMHSRIARIEDSIRSIETRLRSGDDLFAEFRDALQQTQVLVARLDERSKKD
jgi:F0F1-type ATP synthase membrane subunit b/b'